MTTKEKWHAVGSPWAWPKYAGTGRVDWKIGQLTKIGEWYGNQLADAPSDSFWQTHIDDTTRRINQLANQRAAHVRARGVVPVPASVKPVASVQPVPVPVPASNIREALKRKAEELDPLTTPLKKQKTATTRTPTPPTLTETPHMHQEAFRCSFP